MDLAPVGGLGRMARPVGDGIPEQLPNRWTRPVPWCIYIWAGGVYSVQPVSAPSRGGVISSPGPVLLHTLLNLEWLNLEWR
jgi:hypothetical protein